MIPQILNPQRDFSAGEVMEDAARRDDTEIIKSGCRRLLNCEIGQAGWAERRPGMEKKYAGNGRIFKVKVGAGISFDFQFRNTILNFHNNETGDTNSIFGCPWTTADLNNIEIAARRDKVYVSAYRGDGTNMLPQVLTYDEDTGLWSRADFEFRIAPNGSSRVPFYRFSEPGITMALQGNREAGSVVTLTFSENALKSGMVGDYLLHGKSQLRIDSFITKKKCTATVIETTAPIYKTTVANTEGFKVGDSVEGLSSGSKGQIVKIDPGEPGSLYIHVFDVMRVPVDDERMVGPTGNSEVAPGASEVDNQPILVWSEQMISEFRGWPGTVGYDRNRIIFCDLPQLPSWIVWSAAGTPDDLLVGANPADAFAESVPGNERVLYVTGGPDQFVLTDNQIYYIPVSADTPVAPGSTEFRGIGSGGASKLSPVQLLGGLFFSAADRKRIMAVRTTGSATSPYALVDTSRFHSHLVTGPVAIATKPTGFKSRTEVIAVVNEDGSAFVGAYSADRDWIGYAPWQTDGTFVGVAADESEMVFTISRTLSNLDVVQNFERLIEDVPLDGAIQAGSVTTEQYLSINGQDLEINGELLVIQDIKFSSYAGADVHVWDADMYYGIQPIDANGLLPAEIPLTATLWVGFKFDCEMTPFTPNFDGGQSSGQRLRGRKINQYAVTVRDTQEFTVAGVSKAGYTALDNMEIAQPLRNDAFYGRLLGRSADPELQIVQDWPGRFKVLEVGMEVTS